MAIMQRPPNTIHLSGHCEREGRFTAGEAIIPGQLIELYSDSGVLRWRLHNAAANVPPNFVALESLMTNRTVDDAYAREDILTAASHTKGGQFWGLVRSGETINAGHRLQSAGNGYLKLATADTAAAGVGVFRAMDSPGVVTADTRVRVERLW